MTTMPNVETALRESYTQAMCRAGVPDGEAAIAIEIAIPAALAALERSGVTDTPDIIAVLKSTMKRHLEPLYFRHLFPREVI